jgi:hypothetical protein
LKRGALRLAACASLFIATACDGTEGILVSRGTTPGGDAGSPKAEAGGGSLGRGSPSPGVSWQAQLSGAVDPTLGVDLFYVDADFQDAAVLSSLRAGGKLVLCYVSAGTFEPWRDDADDFPADVVGESLENYPREQWLDVRDARVREIMRARIAAMAGAGCDGVNPSTLEAHLQPSGFDLVRTDIIDYAQWFAAEIHAHGMSAGLSVSGDLVPDLQSAYDWALAIDCLSDSGCTPWAPFRQSGRAVLLVEFGDATDAPRVCGAASSLGFDAIIKRPAFDGFRVGCSAP